MLCTLLVISATVAALALRVDACTTCEVNGVKYDVLPGFKNVDCSVDGCHLNWWIVDSREACATACADLRDCQCAVYNPRTGSCNMKRFLCSNPLVGLREDPLKAHVALSFHKPFVVADAAALRPAVAGAVAANCAKEYQQCGGLLWRGTKCCAAGLVCERQSMWFSQCRVSRAPHKPVPKPHKPAPKPQKPTPKPHKPAPKPIPKPQHRPMPRVASGPGQTEGGVYHSTMTTFGGLGTPYGACGVGQPQMVDDNGKRLPFVALNKYSKSGGIGNFDDGSHCGRWIRIEIFPPCGNPNDGSNVATCMQNFGGGAPDAKTGKVIYGYVGDTCGDSNDWCRTDTYHVDMSFDYLDSQGLAANWQNNQIAWSYLTGTPPGWSQSGGLKYYWCSKSYSSWLCIIATNVPNGLSRVEALTSDGWQAGTKNYILGLQYTIPLDVVSTGGKYTIRAFDYDGNPYGEAQLTPPPGVEAIVYAGK